MAILFLDLTVDIEVLERTVSVRAGLKEVGSPTVAISSAEFR